jgi:enoyl-CoA hydratase/carnithine racemase
VLDIDMLRQLNEALRQCDRAATRRQRAASILQRLDAAIAIYRTNIAPSHDANEGIRAFLEKRAAVWSDR